MNKHIKHLAGLALAATIFAAPSFGQDVKPPREPGPPKRVEIEAIDEDTLGLHRMLGDTERTVRKIFAGPMETERPLIISATQLDEKALANLDEDLTIMARVLDKSIHRGAEDGDQKAMGIHLWAIGGGPKGARNMYIDGHGAIFTVNVNMPLIAPATKPEPTEKKETANSTWEEARNELYGRDEERRIEKRKVGDKRPVIPYNAARVEDLKKDLSEALKNATHIRGLKDNDYVTIVVQGAGSGSSQARIVGPKDDVFAFAYAGSNSGGRSTMTLRAKKSDIDAFAKGRTELDDFRKKVSIAVHQTPASSSSDAMQLRRF